MLAPVRSIVSFEAGPEAVAELLELARVAVGAFSQSDGCRGASFLQCLDAPERFQLVTEWEGVGAYRRAMSSAGVKLATYPLLLRCLDEPSAFAEVLRGRSDGSVEQLTTDLGD